MTERLYNDLNTFLKNKFGTKVYKVSLDAGFECPNLDGTISEKGCIFCNNESILPPDHMPGEGVLSQLDRGMEYMRKRHKAQAFIAYLQPFSNTYASLERLKEVYEPLLDRPEIVGLAISTRPDCLDEAKMDYLSRLGKKKFLWLELGLQSVNDDTLKRINRGHDYKRFLDTYEMARAVGVPLCVHIILGLPGETEEMMFKTVMTLSELKIFGIKIHAMHVLKNTPLYTEYLEGNLKLFSLDSYAKLVANCLEVLDPGIVVHRLTGEGPRDLTVAPDWIFNKMKVIDAIKGELSRRGSHQGMRAPRWC